MGDVSIKMYDHTEPIFQHNEGTQVKPDLLKFDVLLTLPYLVQLHVNTLPASKMDRTIKKYKSMIKSNRSCHK